MEGLVVHLFNLWSAKEDCPTWQKFKAALMVRFGGFKEDNPFVNLSELYHVNAIDELIEEFEFMVDQVPKLP